MIGRIKCYFGWHDDEIIQVSILYHMAPNRYIFSQDQLNEINVAFYRNPYKTFYYRCKRCKREYEVGT
jgi:hypothetical protein